MSKVLLGQYFGDGSTQSFDLPRALTSGYVLDVQVGGESVDFDYSDADTVLLAAIPASHTIINFYETNVVVNVKQVITTSVDAKANGGASVANGASGATLSKTKAAVGTFTMLAAAELDRIVHLHVKIDEDFELGTGTLPTFALGETSTVAKFMAATVLVDESNLPTSPNQGKDLMFSGTLSAGKALLLTATAAVGDSTGGITVTAVAVPKA